ncbi:MAG TPA: hypothetical protein ENH82_05285 [bacterium]|nr:hypothetical protein [bacterium]
MKKVLFILFLASSVYATDINYDYRAWNPFTYRRDVTLTTGTVVAFSTTTGAGIFLKQDGSTPLTADWDAGNFQISIGSFNATSGNSSIAIPTNVVILGELDIRHTATGADDHALELDVNSAGFGDVKAIDIDYITGNIEMGEDEGIILINIDEINAIGGDVYGVEILATDGSATIYGVKVGALIGPIHQDSGVFIDPTTGTDNTTTTDVPNMIDGSSTTLTSIFENDNEYILIGNVAVFEEIEFIIPTGASGAGIKPTFGYSISGSHQFTTFTPVDGTNGFRNTGVVAWDASDLTSHVANGDTLTFDIKITRTRNSLATTPILGYAKTAATTEYLWDKNGDLNPIRDIYMEGSTADDFETRLTVTDPTADRTIIFPDVDTNMWADDGSIPLTADWDMGDFKIIISTIQATANKDAYWIAGTNSNMFIRPSFNNTVAIQSSGGVSKFAYIEFFDTLYGYTNFDLSNYQISLSSLTTTDNNEIYIPTNTFTVGYSSGTEIFTSSITIDGNTLDTNEWAFLDGQDQDVSTLGSPGFDGGVTAGSIITGVKSDVLLVEPKVNADSVVNAIKIRVARGGGAGGIGFGTGLIVQLENDSEGQQADAAKYEVIWTDPSNGAEYADWKFSTIENGSFVEALKLSSGAVSVGTSLTAGTTVFTDVLSEKNTAAGLLILDAGTTIQFKINGAQIFQIDSDVSLKIGHSQVSNLGDDQVDLRSSGSSSVSASYTYSDTPVRGSKMRLGRARGTIEAPENIQNNDVIGEFQPLGFHTTWLSKAAIKFVVDGVPSSTEMPVEILFRTGVTSQNTRLTIEPDGDILIAADSFLKFRDSNNSISSPSTGDLTLSAVDDLKVTCAEFIINQTFTNNDMPVTFPGTSNSGRFTWMEDEDLFDFEDVVSFSTQTLIGTQTKATGTADKTLMFGQQSGNPVPGSNTAGLFSKDVFGTAELFAIDEAGNATAISPHDPRTGRWVFNSENIYTGKKVYIDMERVVELLEQLTGEKLIIRE